jgi:tellurite methyltransferase
MADLRTKWNERHAAGQVVEATPCGVLRDFAHLLPKTGKALDLACGLGGNAVFLARAGLDVLGVDLADTAVEKLNAYAQEQSLTLRAEQADVGPGSLKPGTFDVIVVAYFLDRAMSPTIMQALRSGGLLFHQTFTRETADTEGPNNLAYRLTPGELVRLYPGMRLLYYREEGLIGDTTRGLRGEAMLVARKS